jgi:hypothetical protein
MTAHVRPFGALLTDSFLRAVLCGSVAGLVAAAVAGCAAKPVCTRDSDCGFGYICVDNERCVIDPRTDAGTPGMDGGGVDAAPLDASGLEPSSCNSNTDSFDPEVVYLLGSLSGISCSPSAIASLAEPNTESVAFPCGMDAKSAVIRPDGSLVYLDTDTDQVFVFKRDTPPFDPMLDGCTYPADPTANDTEIPTTACANSGKAVAFLIAPEETGAWYTCANTSGQWFDDKHDLIGFLGGSEPLARGYGGWVLARTSAATGSTLELYDEFGQMADTGELAPEGEVLAVRALETGLHVVVEGDGEGLGELFTIELNGGIVSVGAYPSLPAGVTVDPDGAGRVIDANDAMYVSTIDSRQSPARRVVFKLTPGVSGEATEVYSEADGYEVGMDSAALVTGL